MPFDLAILRNEGVPALVTWMGQDIHIRYLPTNHTAEMQKRLQEADGDETADLILRELLAEWDITDGDRPLPVNDESFALIPVGLKLEIVKAIADDLLNPTTTPTRRTSSAPTATSSSGTRRAAVSAATSGPSASPNGSGRAT